MYPTKIALLLCFLVFSAHAATVTWTGAADGKASDAANWDTGVPTAADDVIIDTDGLNIEWDIAEVLTLTLGSASADTSNTVIWISTDCVFTVFDITRGTVNITAGTVSGKDVDSKISLAYSSTYSKLIISGEAIVTIAIVVTDGQVWVGKGGNAANIDATSLSAIVTAEPGSVVGILHATSSAQVVFVVAPADGDEVSIDELWADYGVFSFEEESTVNCVNTFNTTSSSFSGNGTIVNGPDAVSYIEGATFNDAVKGQNDGWIELADYAGVTITFYDESSFENNGEYVANSETYLYDIDTSFTNNGNVTTTSDKNDYSCSFRNYGFSSGEKVIFYNNGGITCPKFEIYYIDVQSGDDS
jgi:hypothetical protein